jgi:hypothetical protein
MGLQAAADHGSSAFWALDQLDLAATTDFGTTSGVLKRGVLAGVALFVGGLRGCERGRLRGGRNHVIPGPETHDGNAGWPSASGGQYRGRGTLVAVRTAMHTVRVNSWIHARR